MMNATTSETAAGETASGVAAAGEAASVPYPGQWRLANIDVVNWGTFCGFHHLPVSRNGLLITGQSGSGKSTLLDAIATALTPPQQRRYNAAAGSGSARRDDRNLVSYIRGAYARNTIDTGEIASMYLRGSRATWSGIMLRYECGLDDGLLAHKSVGLVVLFHLKANCTASDGVSQLFAVVRGDHELREFAPYIENGADLANFNRALGAGEKAYRAFTPYANHFCRLLGIQSVKTLELLHKTLAAKNFGSLDDLFRKFMLDKPETYELADVAVEQFQSLSQAHADVVDQRRQMETLLPLEELAKQHAALQAEVDTCKRYEDLLKDFTTSLAIEQTSRELEAARRRHDSLADECAQAEREFDRAQQDRERAQIVFEKNSGLAIDSAEKDLLQNMRNLENIQVARARLKQDIACLEGAGLPLCKPEFEQLKREVATASEKARLQEDACREADLERSARAVDLQKELAATREELRHLRSQGTNIPRKFHEARRAIALATGMNPADLPFVGELIDVKSDEAAWRGALERLIGRQALVMLVPARVASSVSNYVNDHHLGLLFEYEAVGTEVEVPARTPARGSSVRKFSVVQHASHPEFSLWVSRELRRRFDFACVEETTDLAAHEFALTKAGLIKRKSRYQKDDRYSVDDSARWVLGTSNDAKIATLEEEERRCNQQLIEVREGINAARERTRTADALVRAHSIMQQAQWESYDVRQAEEDVRQAQAYLNNLRTSNKQLDDATRQRDEAREREAAAQEHMIEVRGRLSSNTREIERLSAELAEQKASLPDGWRVNDADRSALTDLFARCNPQFRASTQNLFQASNDVSRLLVKQRDKATDELHNVATQASNVHICYKNKWPSQAADLGIEFAAIDGYLAICRQIKATGLPAYETKFLQVLTEFSQDRITALSTAIRRAFREVKEKLVPVNESLALSEYSPGIHLVIEVRDKRSKQANEFLGELNAIMEGEWSDDDLASAEDRFRRMDAVIRRLASSESVDIRWRDACLDTRQHMSFIAKEVDAAGVVRNIHDTDTGLSGGQKQKLVIFCLAAALRYQLASESQVVPSYGTVILDEAFDKADRHFAKMAMGIFEVFGFHMILATPGKLLKTLEGSVGSVALVRCEEGKRSLLSLVEIERDEGAGRGDARSADRAAAGRDAERRDAEDTVRAATDATVGGAGRGGEGARA